MTQVLKYKKQDNEDNNLQYRNIGGNPDGTDYKRVLSGNRTVFTDEIDTDRKFIPFLNCMQKLPMSIAGPREFYRMQQSAA